MSYYIILCYIILYYVIVSSYRAEVQPGATDQNSYTMNAIHHPRQILRTCLFELEVPCTVLVTARLNLVAWWGVRGGQSLG